MAPRREWTALDEEMAREGDARKRSMRSVGQTPGAKNNTTPEKRQPALTNLMSTGRNFR